MGSIDRNTHVVSWRLLFFMALVVIYITYSGIVHTEKKY